MVVVLLHAEFGPKKTPGRRPHCISQHVPMCTPYNFTFHWWDQILFLLFYRLPNLTYQNIRYQVFYSLLAQLKYLKIFQQRFNKFWFNRKYDNDFRVNSFMVKIKIPKPEIFENIPASYKSPAPLPYPVMLMNLSAFCFAIIKNNSADLVFNCSSAEVNKEIIWAKENTWLEFRSLTGHRSVTVGLTIE